MIFFTLQEKTNKVEDVGTISRKASQHIPVAEQVKRVSFWKTEIEMKTKLYFEANLVKVHFVDFYLKIKLKNVLLITLNFQKQMLLKFFE